MSKELDCRAASGMTNIIPPILAVHIHKEYGESRQGEKQSLPKITGGTIRAHARLLHEAR